jgi:acyl-coenzyme A synthetase/AMP-(fatty) acid ligase
LFQVGLIHFVSFRHIQKERCRISINKTILELFAEHVKKKPEQLAVIHKSEIKITNKELWELSGRIYAWLKSKGIDAEDVVMYNLPRGIELYACILGTLRAGAAFVLTETDNNPKRTEFIKQDCKCKLFVDEDCWKEIINTDSLDGYEPVNLHNLCYIA